MMTVLPFLLLLLVNSFLKIFLKIKKKLSSGPYLQFGSIKLIGCNLGNFYENIGHARVLNKTRFTCLNAANSELRVIMHRVDTAAVALRSSSVAPFLVHGADYDTA